MPTYGDDLQPMWSSAVDAWAGIFRQTGGDVCMAQARIFVLQSFVEHLVRMLRHAEVSLMTECAG